MAERVDSDKIEGIVGVKRRDIEHWAKAVSAEQTVYILHSQDCLNMEVAGRRLLLDCPYTRALDEGIDVAEWIEDVPVRVGVSGGRLVPFNGLNNLAREDT